MDANQFLTQRRKDAERNFERLWSLSKKPLRLRDSASSALKQKRFAHISSCSLDRINKMNRIKSILTILQILSSPTLGIFAIN
jgi:hypothetical protein